MQLVLLTLTPGIAVFIYLTGWGGILNLLIAITTALLTEALATQLRGQSAPQALGDCSAIVTAVLLALCLPPLLPWWIVMLATGFAILLAKHAYGGLGQNLFNPAMAGYALVLISFPLDLSSWIAMPDAFSISLRETLFFVFNGGVSQAANYDALTGATPLSQLYEVRLQTSLSDPAVLSVTPDAQYAWLGVGFLVGGVGLVISRVISWHLPVAVIAGVTVSYLIINDPHVSLPFHLFGGATMLCAFYIATDPVTAPVSHRARLVFVFFIGVLIYLIRMYGSYPDSAAFAVLLMNCCVPMLDQLDSKISTGRRS